MKFTIFQRVISKIRRSYISIKSTGEVKWGRNVYVGRNASVGSISNLTFGDDIYVGKNVTIEVDGSIGRGSLIANNVGVIGRRDHDSSDPNKLIFHSATVRENPELSLPVHVGCGVWIGFGAVVLSGVSIGDKSIIAAGAVITSDVPPGAIMAGNPAKIINIR